MKNYYEILEVNKRASREVIEKAYRVLVKKYHPDLHTGEKRKYAEKKIKDINEAYKILSDEFLKEQYDSELEKIEFEAYKNKYQQKTQNTNVNNTNQQEEIENINENIGKYKVGSFSGLMAVCKELYKNKPKRDEMKEITKKDIFALVLTIVVIITIGIILWVVPFTNGWMRELLFENPIFNWIGGLFSK